MKGEFEGGKSFSIDWFAKLRQGANMLLDNINPDTLKRVVPIYGGLTSYLQVYYCPSDVEVPSRIYSNDKYLQFDYCPPGYFYRHPDQRNKFTIEIVNGARFIIIRHPTTVASLMLGLMNGSETFTGNVPLTANTYNTLPGSSTSMQGTFSDTAYTVIRTLTTALDITKMLNGVAIVPAFLKAAGDIAQITLQLQTDNANFFSMVSTQDSIGDYLRDGQNMIRFWLANASKTGSPNASNITAWQLQIQLKSGKSQTIVLGKMTVQESHLFQFEYYSNLLFVDQTTGAWKDTPISGDSINLNRDALGILHFETCRIVIQGAKTEMVNAAESQRIDTNLTRKYSAYYSRFPSSETPLTYDISPEVALYPDPFFETGMGDIPERIGDNTDADNTALPVNFADGEDLSAGLNGSNQTFVLQHTPDPALSLQLVFNGEVLMLGVGYTLVGKTITLLAPYYTITGVSFVANYRYTI